MCVPFPKVVASNRLTHIVLCPFLELTLLSISSIWAFVLLVRAQGLLFFCPFLINSPSTCLFYGCFLWPSARSKNEFSVLLWHFNGLLGPIPHRDGYRYYKIAFGQNGQSVLDEIGMVSSLEILNFKAMSKVE